MSIKFVTNTTKDSKKTLHERLTKIGFKLEATEIYSSLSAAAAFVTNEKLNPLYLLTDDARQDFPDEDKIGHWIRLWWAWRQMHSTTST